ncbi:hypothetical protein DFH94DRAFT_686379 [Russula ochroleuca]|uniref:Uncharacterized protein n=1 Tax=Russula ochroleuca TaxID=152965 RepID=A0A9P5JUM8_9AGAM|nr:hypothetical protein DFH94DRAFT_686379 [Russula ochroleuca]
MWLDSVVSQGKHAWCLRVDEGIGIVSEDIVEHPRARWCPAWAWAWAWAWVWVWAWASIAYKAETYLTQPSSEGGRMGGRQVGVGVWTGVGQWQRHADREGKGEDWAKLGEGVIGMDTLVWPEFLTLTSVAS